MKSLIPRSILLFLFFVVSHSLIAQNSASFTAASLKRDVNYLASPAMRGRDTPSTELDSAAHFIARRFQQYGLHPLAGSSYLQPFELARTQLGDRNSLSFYKEGQVTSLKIKNEFSPHPLSGSGTVQNAPLVFAGYGITAPEYDYDDYAKIDVTGAVVFILTLEPQAKDSAAVFNGIKKTAHAKLKTKLDNARAHGAAAVIFMAGPRHNKFRRPPNAWPSLMRKPDYRALGYRPVTALDNALPSVQVGLKGAARLFDDIDMDILALQTAIDSTLTPHSFYIKDRAVSMALSFVHKRRTVNNVIGWIEGSDDSLKSEAVIIGGHYDHLGMQADTLAYAGADDNASGTATVMALASGFTGNSSKPRRSMIFSAWAGEEKGLLGAGHFVNHAPLWPLARTAAYINIDMVGRLDSSTVNIAGTETVDGWEGLVTQSLAQQGLKFYNRKGVSRSDHVHFYESRIPVLGISTGFHKDYHKVTDTPEKCNFEGMAKITEALFTVIRNIADSETKAVFREDPDSPLTLK